MVLALLRCRIMSMLYIFMIHDEFANIFSKKCWQIFRYSEIWQHQLTLIASSTNFDAPKPKKCWQKSIETKNCTTFSILLQPMLYYKFNIVSLGAAASQDSLKGRLPAWFAAAVPDNVVDFFKIKEFYNIADTFQA